MYIWNLQNCLSKMMGNEHPVNVDHPSFKYRNHSDLSAVPEVLLHIQSFKSRLALCCWLKNLLIKNPKGKNYTVFHSSLIAFMHEKFQLEYHFRKKEAKP